MNRLIIVVMCSLLMVAYTVHSFAGVIPRPVSATVTIKCVECKVSQEDYDEIQLDSQVDHSLSKGRWTKRSVKTHGMFSGRQKFVETEFTFTTNLLIRVREWDKDKWYRNDSDGRETIGVFLITSDHQEGEFVYNVYRGRTHYRVYFTVKHN